MASRHGHEIDATRRLNVFKTLSRPLDTSINHTTLGFHRKFKNRLLAKQKARLVARGFTQVSGVDYNDTHLYAPVLRLECFRVLLSIPADPTCQ